jgi:hypothetical protein
MVPRRGQNRRGRWPDFAAAMAATAAVAGPAETSGRVLVFVGRQDSPAVVPLAADPLPSPSKAYWSHRARYTATRPVSPNSAAVVAAAGAVTYAQNWPGPTRS